MGDKRFTHHAEFSFDVDLGGCDRQIGKVRQASIEEAKGAIQRSGKQFRLIHLWELGERACENEGES